MREHGKSGGIPGHRDRPVEEEPPNGPGRFRLLQARDPIKNVFSRHRALVRGAAA